MEKELGKLIVLWNPIKDSMGATTTAIALATICSNIGHKKTLVTSMSNDSKLELYVTNDRKIKYSLDNLQVLQDKLTIDDIVNHATPLNNDLDIIGGFRVYDNNSLERSSLCGHFIDAALKKYDFVIIDLSNSDIDKSLLQKADITFSLLPFEEESLESIMRNDYYSYITSSKNISIFNNLPLGVETEFESILPHFGIEKYAYLPTNKFIYFHVGFEHKLYSFITDNIVRTKQIYIQQLIAIYEMLKYELNIKDTTRVSKFSNIFSRISAM